MFAAALLLAFIAVLGGANAQPAPMEVFCGSFDEPFECYQGLKMIPGRDNLYCYEDYCQYECQIQPTKCPSSPVCDDLYAPEAIKEACLLSKMDKCYPYDWTTDMYEAHLCNRQTEECHRFHLICPKVKKSCMKTVQVYIFKCD